MSASRGLAVWFLFVPMLVVTLLGGLSPRSCHAGDAPISLDKPTRLASVAVPDQPYSVAWSADGSYLAAATVDDGLVFVVDVAKASVTKTLKTKGWVQGLAFSPDGKWLAVVTSRANPFTEPAATETTAELVVLDVPAHTTRFTAKSGGPMSSFLDLAWAADSKTLYAIDSRGVSKDRGTETEAATVRRWAVPTFTEQLAIRGMKARRYKALAASPDGRNLAILADIAPSTTQQVVRLIDIDSGAERSSFTGPWNFTPTVRLGFTPDSKAVGVLDAFKVSWWDVDTGQPAKPDPSRFAIPPAALGDAPHLALSADGRRQAKGSEVHPTDGMGLPDILFAPKNKFGTFVRMTDTATAKTWTWRVGEQTQGSLDAPAVAFSPDGTKLAATVKELHGASILIVAVPK
jgi:WD40 repeat protein